MGARTIPLVIAMLIVSTALVPALASASPSPGQLAGFSLDNIVTIVRPDGTSLELGRCGTPTGRGGPVPGPLSPTGGSTADCDDSSDPTTIGGAGSTIYDPSSGGSYLIDVWVHVIENADGSLGDVPVAEIYEQIAVLNEDYRAIPGSNGDAGWDTRLFFRLKGYEVSNNTTWYQDGGAYYNSLAVTPATVVNVYTNNAQGFLGYVPFLPHESPASIGTNADRVVIYWEAFGRNRGLMPEYDLGRSLSHELGHFFGLPHTFDDTAPYVCADGTVPACFSDPSGDLICDTPPEQTANFGCPGTRDTCTGVGPDPIHNYMDYSDDPCMDQFTHQQGRRKRCTIENYRSGLLQPILFYDDFETGNTNAWDVPF